MKYLLSVPKAQYERIQRCFSDPSPSGKAAFLLTDVNQGKSTCLINVTEFFAADDLRTDAQTAGFSIQSPLMMDAIDRAMETGKSFLYLYSDPGSSNASADPAYQTNKQIVIRIAYHYLPSGLHACMAFRDAKLSETAWLKGATPQQVQIHIKAS